MNNKLNKPRAFAASPNSILVQFGSEQREVTNLTRSALLIQTEVLVANAGVWHHVEIADLALDSVHLPSFKNYIEQHGILLSDIGIIESEPMTNHELKHDDFMSLQTSYPKHSYIDIQKLHRYEKERGNPSSRAHLIKVLKAISQDFLHINGWISATEERKAEMLKSSSTTLLESLEEEAFDLTATIGTQEAQSVSEQPKLPNPNNKLLNAFYMHNLEIVESERFQEDAALFAKVLSYAGNSIQSILENPDVTIQKSVAVTELIKTWKL